MERLRKVQAGHTQYLDSSGGEEAAAGAVEEDDCCDGGRSFEGGRSDAIGRVQRMSWRLSIAKAINWPHFGQSTLSSSSAM